jgi:hypothetical protein
MTSDTTKADQKAELARQAYVIEEVERAHKEELPGLGDDNGVPKGDEADVPASTTAGVRSVTTGPVQTTELARDKGKG